jgi:hypothetical protein
MMGVLALVALLLVPLLLHGHDHGSHGPTTSAPCAACATSHQTAMSAATPGALAPPRLVSLVVAPRPIARPGEVDCRVPVGRGPPPILVVPS